MSMVRRSPPLGELPLFATQHDEGVPPSPSGPAAERYTPEAGTPSAFLLFVDTDDGRAFWDHLVAAAWAAWERGEGRFSTRTFLSRYRDDEKVRINNDFSPWFADKLIQQYPVLGDIIERRKRKKLGPMPFTLVQP